MSEAKEVYESYASAFEDAVTTGDWAPIGGYFSPDARYVDSMGVTVVGCDEIVAHLRASVEGLDNKFRSRNLSIHGLTAAGADLKHEWRIEYTDNQLPTLSLGGHTEASVVGSQIVSLVDTLSEASRKDVADWLSENGHRLG